MNELRICAARGAALLDSCNTPQAEKEWFEKIILDKFHMRSTKSCVLKQLYEDFLLGLEALNLTMAESVQYGFAAQRMSQYNALTEAWVTEILDRLGKKVARVIAPYGCEFAGFGPFAVNVEGDARTYYPSVFVRFPITMPMDQVGLISTLTTNSVRGISRILLDIPTT